MDTKLRELERKALGGDPEAEKRFLMEKLRVGGYYPVLLQFYAEAGWNSLVTAYGGSGGPTDVYNFSKYLRHAGVSNLDCGPVLPVEGILRSVSVSANNDSSCEYTAEIAGIGWDQPWDRRILAKSKILGAEIKASVNRELCARIPGGVPLGVRIGGDQSSTFSAICVALEIWISK